AAKEALDDPRDAQTPDGDDPRDRALEDAMAAVAETQAAFDDAAAHAREVRNSGGDVTPSDLAAWEAFKALKAAKAAKAALEDPGDQADGDDPRDAPTPDGDDPRDVAIKATTAAQTSTGKALARTQVKALAPDQTNVALPAAGADKPQTGAGADPMHCTTGNDGSCTLHGNRKELGLPANTPDSVNVAVADPAVKSFNLQVQPGTQPIGALTDFVTDSQQIGDQSFITVTAPVEQADLLQALIGQQPDLIAVEENICGDKEPAGIMPGCPVSAFDRGQG
ncbi:MAG TPA: hypothetical protein VED46_13295, partial [Alphaproteobacteria bacterium]|nr:hypothetical protein [Alphaproteobacteria bacterium]